MTKSKQLKIILSRLARIEKKCDRIIAEMAVSRRQRYADLEVDATIDKLHTMARRMREISECERSHALELLTSGIARP